MYCQYLITCDEVVAIVVCVTVIATADDENTASSSPIATAYQRRRYLGFKTVLLTAIRLGIPLTVRNFFIMNCYESMAAPV